MGVWIEHLPTGRQIATMCARVTRGEDRSETLANQRGRRAELNRQHP
eukprot:SAG31_NODE_24497_length_480_cov_0.876640_2_plen_46_part_01